MKKYIAFANMSYSVMCEFEVEDGQDPWDLAEALDGGSFEKIPDSGEWDIYEVREVKPPNLTPDQTRFFKAFTECMDQYPLTLEEYIEFVNGNEDVVEWQTITALYDARNLWASAVESVNV